MLQDLSTLPVTGSALLAGAAYAALSLLVTGPLVAERTIETSGWPARCASRSLESTVATEPSLPSIDCGAILGTLYGRDGAAVCARYGEALSLPFDVLGALREEQRSAARARAAQQVAASGLRCACAVRTVLDERRIDLALYAGTARLVTPLSVRTLDAELARAVQAPICAIGG